MRALRVEIVVFTVRDGRLETALVRGRANTWGMPGAPAGASGTLAGIAEEALAAQTGIRDAALEQLFTFDRNGGAGAAVAYLCLVNAGSHPLTPGRDVVEVRWFPWGDTPEIPDDQADALAYARERLRAKAAYAPVATHLLPGLFTISDLQRVYEAVLGRSLDTRNFRRDLISAGVVERLERTRSSGRGRPAALYRWAPDPRFAVVAAERRLARALGDPPSEGAVPTPEGGGGGQASPAE